MEITRRNALKIIGATPVAGLGIGSASAEPCYSREGYRLACQCVPIEAVTVELAPPLEERSFQILGAGPGLAGGVAIDSGVDKQVVKVALPREEHHQTSDV